MGKGKAKINNWKQYNQALVNRGSVTFWINLASIEAWLCLKHHAHRGRGFIFSNTKIETTLMVKGIFKLPLRRLRRLSQFSSYLDECPAEIPYIHLH